MIVHPLKMCTNDAGPEQSLVLFLTEINSVPDIWTMTCYFQQCGILSSVDSDEPVEPPVKLRNSKWCSVSSLTVI